MMTLLKVVCVIILLLGVGIIAWLRVAEPEAIRRFWLGLRPEIDPNDYRVARDLSQINVMGVEAEDFRLDRWETERQMAEEWFTRPWLLRAGIIASGFSEMLGAILVMRALGYEPPERAFLGIALAAIVFALAIVVGKARSTGAKWGFRLGILAFGLLVICIGIVRMNEVGSDHESFSMLVAAVVIGVALSVGPALLAEFLAQKLRQSVPLARRYTLAKNRHRSAERERNAAEKNMIRRHNAIECYNRRVDRLMGFLRAIGNRHFSRRSGRTPTGETEREVLQNE